MTFRVERSSADVRDGFYGAVRLILFREGRQIRRCKRRNTRGTAVSRRSAYPLEKTRIGGVASSAKISHTNYSITGVNANLTSLRMIGRNLFDKSGKFLRK